MKRFHLFTGANPDIPAGTPDHAGTVERYDRDGTAQNLASGLLVHIGGPLTWPEALALRAQTPSAWIGVRFAPTPTALAEWARAPFRYVERFDLEGEGTPESSVFGYRVRVWHAGGVRTRTFDSTEHRRCERLVDRWRRLIGERDSAGISVTAWPYAYPYRAEDARNGGVIWAHERSEGIACASMTGAAELRRMHSEE